ncbi:hypothetical protein FGF66_11765 [Chlorobaculum thiosulfatiphilum]|uniref:DUF2971 domain-containing protein n=1 Tax=Chlorobaculum thiosulfatiphilum TaxID=115852 RepID=A0A5C4S0J7_CHLTI|nr:hypothetical protein [Chlorobaculum thiosulfatiphilum]TNJ36567.1 hypothetical protein FGF66_11765 [Chlorobaculum thiosulfatiphilum]
MSTEDVHISAKFGILLSSKYSEIIRRYIIMTIVYKYLGLSTCRQKQNVERGLISGELWFSKFFDQNDPMEGIFWHENGLEKVAKQITSNKNKYVICSFGSNAQNTLLWSYYANGFRGVCMGFEVDDKLSDILVEPINYVRMSEFKEAVINEKPPQEIAKEVITRKLDFWKKEGEKRLLKEAKSGFVKVGQCTSLYFGMNIGKNELNEVIEYINCSDFRASLKRAI